MDEVQVLDSLNQLLQQHGSEFGFSESSFDCDKKSGEVIFRYGDKSWLISSLGKFEEYVL